MAGVLLSNGRPQEDVRMDSAHRILGTGSMGRMLINNNFDVRCLRPFIDKRGNDRILRVNGEGKEFVTNAPVASGLFRTRDWLHLDEVILKAAKPRLRAVGDIRASGNVYTIPDGMAKTILQYEAQSDITPADVSMNGLRQSQADRPEFQLFNLPLPIFHKDFHINARDLMVSRNGNSPLDTTNAELAGRRVAEVAEQYLIGTITAYSYGGGAIYGYTNFPSRITGSLTQKPFVSSALNTNWTPNITITDVLNMKNASAVENHFGPWMLYCGLSWDPYMDGDYVAVQVGTAPQTTTTGVNMTLRERLRKIDNLIDVRTLDFLPRGTSANPAFDLVMVQFTPEVVRLVMGMDITTIQWMTDGGMDFWFKVMCIMVPQLRADINSNTGIVHYN